LQSLKKRLRARNTYSAVPIVPKRLKKSNGTLMAAKEYDAIIVGGGPGGLSAAIIAGLRGMKVLVVDGGSFGGLLANLYPQKLVLNYPGLPEGAYAKDIAKNLVEQAKGLDIEMKNERANKITGERIVKTEDGEYRGNAIIIATGSRPKVVGVLGEMEFNLHDRGVYYYVTDKDRFAGKKVVIAGGGDTAIDSVLSIVDEAEKIILVHRRRAFRALEFNLKKVLNSDKVKVYLESHIVEIKGVEDVGSVVLEDKNGDVQEIEAEAVILAFGQVPNNEIFADLGLKLDYEGKIITDSKQKTNLDGFYAVGDIVAGTGSLELIVVAVAQGAVAAHHAYLETATPYWG
jgi:thioredoxin reductase (NADPH)